jgi:hypothetical protein
VLDADADAEPALDVDVRVFGLAAFFGFAKAIVSSLAAILRGCLPPERDLWCLLGLSIVELTV